MLGLAQSMTCFQRIGQQGGKPAYSETGTAYACRAEPDQSRALDDRGAQSSSGVRIFAPAEAAGNIAAGDRIVLDSGDALIVTEVQVMRGLQSVHHVEILAKGEA